MFTVVEGHSNIMAKTEEQIYRAELAFYSGVREITSDSISDKFEDGFIAWLF